MGTNQTDIVYLVHFDNLSSIYDEWIVETDPRLKPVDHQSEAETPVLRVSPHTTIYDVLTSIKDENLISLLVESMMFQRNRYRPMIESFTHLPNVLIGILVEYLF